MENRASRHRLTQSDADAFRTTNPAVKWLNAAVVDPNWRLRGKALRIGALDKIVKDGLALPVAIHGFDIWGGSVDETGLYFD